MLPIPSISHSPLSALLLKFPCMAPHPPHFPDLFCETTQTAPPAPALGGLGAQTRNSPEVFASSSLPHCCKLDALGAKVAEMWPRWVTGTRQMAPWFRSPPA